MDRIEKLKEFLRTDPNDSFSKHALALEYSKLGDDVTARRLLEEVLEFDPASIGSYYQLGKLLERTGESGLALMWYEKGMVAARAAGEKRAYNELQVAYEDLVD
jgi:Tfp pilus assembly protein PilF